MVEEELEAVTAASAGEGDCAAEAMGGTEDVDAEACGVLCEAEEGVGSRR